MTIRFAIALGAAILLACMPQTDRNHYSVDETGTVRFENVTDATLYLGGCNHFDYEKRVAGEWVAQAPDVVCVWEGFAEPVSSGAVVIDPIRAREPGIWRLRYPVGVDCTATSPLSTEACRAVGHVTSNRFEVHDSGCVISGCSSQICADRAFFSTCEWLPQYACFRETRCGRFGPEGTCTWEATPEFAACLAEVGATGPP